MKPDSELSDDSDKSNNGGKRQRIQIKVHDMESAEISVMFPISTQFINDAWEENLAAYDGSGGTQSRSGEDPRGNEAENGARVLVHCMAGRSRSATLILAWLMEHEKMTLREAFDWVLPRRPIIFPNPGFLAQLQDLEKKLYDGKMSTLPPAMQEVQQHFATQSHFGTSDSVRKIYRRYLLTASNMKEEDLVCEERSEHPLVLDEALESAAGVWRKHSTLAGPSCAREILECSLEELPALSRKAAVWLLCGICMKVPSKLTKREVEEAFFSMKNDEEFRENVRLDVPLESRYFEEIERELLKKG